MKPMFLKNKWFIAFVIAAVVALAGIITAIVIGVTSAPPGLYRGR